MRRAVPWLLGACCALLLASCHSRPLRAQMPRRPPPDGGAARGPSEWHGHAESPLTRRLQHLKNPFPFVLTEKQLETIRRARALRDPANRTPRAHGPTAAECAEACAREFASHDNPAKAHRPGAVDVDVGRLLRFLHERLR
jgi:hypothetical protein